MNNKQNKAKTDRSSVISLGLGIASIFLWEFSIVPILAIGFGILAAFRTKNNEWQMWVGIALGLLFLVVRIYHGNIDRGFLNFSSNSNTPQTSAVPTTQKHIYRSGSYYASFLQTGGMTGSRSAQLSARLVDVGSGYLMPPENYINFYINIPGNHVWVNCAQDNFHVTNPESLSTNNKFIIDPKLGIGMELIDQKQNLVTFICEPQ